MHGREHERDADRATPEGFRAPKPAQAQPSAPAATQHDLDSLAGAPPAARARAIGALQSGMGNAVLARKLDPKDAAHRAEEVHEAIDGWGTDEDRMGRAFAGITHADVSDVGDAYRDRYERDMLADIRDDMSDEDIDAIDALRPSGPEAIARELHEAMDGLGTDEGQIQRALAGVTDADLAAVEREYRKLTGNDLRKDLEDELSTDDFRRLPVYQEVGLDSIAQRLHDAMEGWGTDEDQIYALLSGRSKGEIDQIAASYKRQTGHALADDLRDELSDDELERLEQLSPALAAGSKPPTADASAKAIAGRLQAAMSGWGTDEDAIYAALSNRTPEQRKAIADAYRELTGRALIDDLKDELSGDDLQRALTLMGEAPQATEEDTELGGLIVGNFDFTLDGGKIDIEVRVEFEFEDGIADQKGFKKRFFDAIHGTWQHPPFKLAATGADPIELPITITCVESEDDPHKTVDVSATEGRASVVSDINVWQNESDATLAHEFGHVLGLYDEYDSSWTESLWHQNRTDDPGGLMLDDGQAASDPDRGLRPRYLEHIRQRVQDTAPPGVVYRIVHT